MNTSAQKSWPKTAEGTTDWEVVFEAPDGGLVQLVTQAQSLDALNECASVVIRSLFTRKGDEAEVIRFMKLLDLTIAKGRETDDVINTRTSVEFLLRRIKQERIDKAQTYIAQKNSKQAIERRAKKADKDKSRMMAIAAGVALVVISGGVAAWLLAGPAELVDNANPSDATVQSDPNWTPAARETVAKEEVAAPEPAPIKKPKKSAKAENPTPQNTYPKAVMLKPFYWSYAAKGGGVNIFPINQSLLSPRAPSTGPSASMHLGLPMLFTLYSAAFTPATDWRAKKNWLASDSARRAKSTNATARGQSVISVSCRTPISGFVHR